MQNEVERKESKSLEVLPLDAEIIKRYFDEKKKNKDELSHQIKKISEIMKTQKSVYETIDMKNSIPRFDT
jgi:hypothetical protein